MPFTFEKLIVWRKVVDISDLVNQAAKEFPKEEIYILSSQIKRAADSVSLHIAEGLAGQINPAFNRFPGYGLRSNIEVVGCIYPAKRVNIISESYFTQISQLSKKYQE